MAAALGQYDHMLHAHFLDRVRRLGATRRERLAALSTAADAEAYAASMHAPMAAAFSTLPAERCPLNAVTTGRIEGDLYDIELVHFDSRPGLPVTANLYLPKACCADGATVPGIVHSCGHSFTGKAEDKYQEASARLASSGMAVLIFDPINQGERDQYCAACASSPSAEAVLPPSHHVRAACTCAHNMMGKQMEQLGDFFGAWRAWDGMVALDYLLSRPEIDRDHLGITGNSGGGTMTSWIWGLDARFTMAAPSCFITTFEKNLENEIPADAEQYPPGVLGAGLEMADTLLASNFPKPLLLCGQRHCFFDRRGLQEAYEDLRQLYALVGKEEQVDLFIGEHDHGFHSDAQQKVAEFFCKHAGLPPPSFSETEFSERFEPLPTAALEVCRGGQVLGFCPGATPVFQTLGSAARQLAQERNSSSLSPLELCESLRQLLTLEPQLPAASPSYRVLRTGKQVDPPIVSGKSAQLPQHIIQRIAVCTEAAAAGGSSSPVETILHKPLPLAGGYTASFDVGCGSAGPGAVGVAGDGTASTRVHVPDLSAAEELLTSPAVLTWLGWGDGAAGDAGGAGGEALYVVEVRGMGESWPEGPAAVLTSGPDGVAGPGPDTADGTADASSSFTATADGRHPRWASYGMDYMYHGHALLFGESMLGRRVWDLLRTLQLLAREAGGAACLGPLTLSGRGSGSMVALFGAMMAGPVCGLEVSRLSLRHMPTSCEEWVSAAVCHWPASCSLKGLLRVCDLPDCWAALHAQGIEVDLTEPWDAMMMPATDSAATAAAAAAAAGAVSKL
jgi:hypothetical protein